MTTERIRALLSEAREHRAFSAAAWSYGDASGAWSRGHLGTLAWDGPAVAEDSRWDLASVTKPLVAIAVLSLVEDGIISLEDTLADLLVGLPADKGPITVAQLLTHSSGLPGQIPLFRWNPTSAALLDAVRGLPLSAEPGTRVTYSSQGFMLLGLLVEEVTGQRLDQVLHERVFDPAGMPTAGFDLAEEVRSRAVATEDDPWRGHVVQGEVHDENAVVIGRPAGHAGVFATLADLENLARALCRQGAGADGPLLAGSTHRVMTEPRTDHLNARWSLGWAMAGSVPHGTSAGDLIGRRGYGHTGFTGTSLWLDPDTGRYSILLTNRVHPSREGPGIARVRRLVNNLAFGATAPTDPRTGCEDLAPGPDPSDEEPCP